MSYQALLFCADEKLARVVTQVFTELEFNVEPVNDPFSAVKKLMAQHYDAVVVDCENEQNASLLFKSARNSAANQSSLALALVEGQAGVAKAYRIGANLVLTKPINVEQAKGTLRVARGLLRKNADAAAAASATPPPVFSRPESAPAKPPLAFATQPEPAQAEPRFQPPRPISAQDSSSAPRSEPAFAMPELEPAMPAMAASAKYEEDTPVIDEPIVASTPEKNAPEKVEAVPVAKPLATPAISPKPSFTTFQSAAAAPAPAKDTNSTVKGRTQKEAESDLFETTASKPRAMEVAPPTFSALDSHGTEGSGSARKFVVIAAVAALVIAIGYFGWTKFGRSGAPSAPQSAMQTPPGAQQSPAPSVPATTSPSTTISEPEQAAPASTPAVSPSAAKPKPGSSNTTPVTKISADKQEPAAPEVVTRNLAATPIHVKTATAPAVKPQQPAQSDDSAPVPNPLAVGSGNDNTLASVVSAPASLPVAPVGTLKISQGVSQGLLIKKVQPEYPQNARAMRIEGSVQMQALIDKEGKITNVKVVKGHPVLARAAVDAVRQWRYKPYYLDGQPVEIQTEITVVFKLPN